MATNRLRSPILRVQPQQIVGQDASTSNPTCNDRLAEEAAASGLEEGRQLLNSMHHCSSTNPLLAPITSDDGRGSGSSGHVRWQSRLKMPSMPPWLLSGLRPCVTTIAVVLLLKLAVLVAVATGPTVCHVAQNAFRAIYYSWDPMLFGRNDAQFPAPLCCAGAACMQQHTGRVAALTYIRSDHYVPLLQQLECTFRRSNPGVELGVMSVEGELSEKTLRWLERRNLTLIEVPPLYYPNHYAPRYGQNWLKLRALALTQYDAVLLLDSDVAVVGDLSPLFFLPTDFAASWDQTRWLGRFNTLLRSGINGGVLLMRPCPAVGDHMLGLLRDNPKLRFSHGAAEQDFLNWYYRYTGFMLPLEYNAMAADSLQGGPTGPATTAAAANLTIGGRSPVVVHFTQHKPFDGAQPGRPGHQFLCSLEELRSRWGEEGEEVSGVAR